MTSKEKFLIVLELRSPSWYIEPN